MAEDRKLTMKFAGSLVQHLGLQMYSGAVPAIAELIANAWDADATTVEVTVPFDTPIDDDLVIDVRDDGHGMSFAHVDDRYLTLGRNRRKTEGEYTAGGRRVLGRKGIGKLAGFGIARIVEVWTVQDGHLTAFEMNYDDITKSGTAEFGERYEPPVIADRPVEAGDPLQSGTLVRLKRLQVKQAIPEERFRRSMARRFSLLTDRFEVSVNDEPLERGDMELQFRFPEDAEMGVDDVPGVGQIRWWAGFTKTPIAVDEARGIAVLAHGKLVQAPFFFEVASGTQGQLGLQYLTGEVHADSLDEDADLIATDRASVLWENPRAAPLLEWGQAKVRELLREWSDKRREEHESLLRDTTPYMAMVARFPDRERAELTKAITTLASIATIDDDRLTEIVEFLVNAYSNDYFMNVIRALNAAGPEAFESFADLISEWDVLEAINTARTVRGRVEVIRTFARMIKDKVPEKPDMQEFVKKHPWLLEPAWDVLRHEQSLDRVIAEEFDLDKTGEDQGRTRLDYFCLADSSLAVVVELKRPGDLVGLDELDQIERYVDFLRRSAKQSTGDQRKYDTVRGCFVYSRMKEEAHEKRERLRKDGIDVVTWRQLLQTAERLHREFLDVVKERAPQDDPRIKALETIPDEPLELPPAEVEDEPATRAAAVAAPRPARTTGEAPTRGRKPPAKPRSRGRKRK